MSVKLDIFYPRLQQLIGKPDLLKAEGSTVGECLNDLVRQFPDAKKWLFDEQGRLLRHVYVFINEESVQKAELAAPVRDTDRLIIAALLTGG